MISFTGVPWFSCTAMSSGVSMRCMPSDTTGESLTGSITSTAVFELMLRPVLSVKEVTLTSLVPVEGVS